MLSTYFAFNTHEQICFVQNVTELTCSHATEPPFPMLSLSDWAPEEPFSLRRCE